MALNANSYIARLSGFDTVVSASQQRIARSQPVQPVDTVTALPDALDQRQQRSYQEQQTALAKLAPVRPSVSPSDELELFAQNSETISGGNDAVPTPTLGEAVAEDGTFVEVESIPPEDINQQLELIPFTPTLVQASASALYARNNNALFSLNPFVAVAA